MPYRTAPANPELKVDPHVASRPTLDPEQVRFSLELRLLEPIQRLPEFPALAERVLADLEPSRIRRALLASSLRLTPSMAPVAVRLAATAAATLGVVGEIELYQSRGLENAAMHLVEAPILLEIQGRLLSLLDDGAMLCVFGHELGHYLAHGSSSSVGRAQLAARFGHHELPLELSNSVARLQVAQELTADRFGLLACRDLEALLRLEMATTTGLATGDLTWDTQAYLAQCQELMAACLAGEEQTLSTSHPEHALRAYAAWLFYETTEFRAWTGLGPGTRSLVDVDRTLEQLLGAGKLEPSLGLEGEPPIELYECGLAAGVVVATSDGEMVAQELEALERVFSPHVADFQAYLQLPYALQRFEQSAPVVREGGLDWLRALFLLLTHVMGADGEVDEREVGVILSLGERLGAKEPFRRWMESTLRTLGLDVQIVDRPLPALPLPPRQDDVAGALDAFFAGVARRGSASIALRRLLRLAGYSVLDAASKAHLSRALQAYQLRVEPALEQAGLEDLLLLVAPPQQATQVMSAQPAPPRDEVRRQLSRGLARLRDQLVSGDGRSPSVRLSRLRSGRSFDLFELEQVSLGMAERALTLVASGRSARLVDSAESGAHRGAHGCVQELLALDRAHRDRLEESGAHDLYVGHPFLSGAVAPPGASLGYPVRAPLVLYPVELERDGRGARGFRLNPRKGEPPIVNQSLLRLVFHKRRGAFPDTLAEALDALLAEEGLEALLVKLSEVGLVIARPSQVLSAFEERRALDELDLTLKLEENAVLGLFPQSSSDLLQDYDALLQQIDGSQPIDLGEVLAGASLLVPSIEAKHSARADERALVPLLTADPTQREVLDACRAHAGVVVDGPPGTGKSQVIVNLVMDAVRRGERVAVVCEKRAALDVVHQRVSGLGLGHACALVHDVHEDRRPLYAQLEARLEAPRVAVADTGREALVAEHKATVAHLDGRAQLLGAKAAETELSVGQLLTLHASTQPREPDLAVDGAPIASLTLAQLLAWLELLPQLAASRELWGPRSAFRSPPDLPPRRSLAHADEATLLGLVTGLERAQRAAAHYEQALGGLGADASALLRLGPVLHEDRQLRSLRADSYGAQIYASLLRAPWVSAPRSPVDDAVVAAQRVSRELAMFTEPVNMPGSNELVAAIAVARRWLPSFLRFFVFGYWSARGLIARAVRAAWPEQAGRALDLAFLEQLSARIAATGAWAAAHRAFTSLGAPQLLPRDSAALLPTLDRTARLQAHVGRLRQAGADLQAVGLPAPGSVAMEAWDQAVEQRLELLTRHRALQEALAPLLPFFPWLSRAQTTSALGSLRLAFEREGSKLARVDALCERAAALAPGGAQVLDALAAHQGSFGEAWRQATLHAWSGAQLSGWERQRPELAQLGTPADQQRTRQAGERLTQLEQARAQAEVAVVHQSLDQAPFLQIPAPEPRKRRSPEQAVREDMLKEVRKKRNVMALRSFVRKFGGAGLLDVAPIWLLSPETMTILFPREPWFDLVVFDEASQCTVESGFPVLLRAKRVVVAGDEKQMPPTSFFKLGASTDEGDEGEPTEPDDLARDAIAAESLLSLARTRLHHAGLRWHYRCQDEALIAFSNHAMYDGSLLTIPRAQSPAAASALRWRTVDDGVYDDGANEPEARAVVELVDELLSRTPAPTVGVVTFNLKQRRAILDAIDSRVASDERFAALWSAAIERERVDERPFIKNLESVQGDERDVIVFSLGHAPVVRKRKDGHEQRFVPARFGPLGLRGGERRLNVAISRAKQETYVVSSFDPALLSAATAQNAGPRLFREYLEFAHAMGHGQRAQAERVLSRVRESRVERRAERKLPLAEYVPLATQLALALEAESIGYELDVGASEFRVPLALLDPRDPSRYALAVLTDEGDEALGAFERYVHRPAVLQTRGWRVMHVDAATWSRDRRGVIDALRAAVGASA